MNKQKIKINIIFLHFPQLIYAKENLSLKIIFIIIVVNNLILSSIKT